MTPIELKELGGGVSFRCAAAPLARAARPRPELAHLARSASLDGRQEGGRTAFVSVVGALVSGALSPRIHRLGAAYYRN